MKNKISGLLMEVGAPYSKSRLHGQTYFQDWPDRLDRAHEREKERGNRNRATLAVARKMAAYMLAVDKSQKDFIMKNIQAAA